MQNGVKFTFGVSANRRARARGIERAARHVRMTLACRYRRDGTRTPNTRARPAHGVGTMCVSDAARDWNGVSRGARRRFYSRTARGQFQFSKVAPFSIFFAAIDSPVGLFIAEWEARVDDASFG